MRDNVPGEARLQKEVLEELNEEDEETPGNTYSGDPDSDEITLSEVSDRLEATDNSEKVKEILNSYGRSKGRRFARAGLEKQRAGAVGVKIARDLTESLHQRQKSDIEEFAETLDVISLGYELLRDRGNQDLVEDYVGSEDETIHGVPSHSVTYELATSFMDGYQGAVEKTDAPEAPGSYTSPNLTD